MESRCSLIYCPDGIPVIFLNILKCLYCKFGANSRFSYKLHRIFLIFNYSINLLTTLIKWCIIKTQRLLKIYQYSENDCEHDLHLNTKKFPISIILVWRPKHKDKWGISAYLLQNSLNYYSVFHRGLIIYRHTYY